MKNVFILLMLAIQFGGCSSIQKNDVGHNLDAVKVDMASLNKTLRGYLYRKIYINDLSKLNEPEYKKHAKDQAAPSEREYIEFLDLNVRDLAINATEKDFVVCVKSEKPALVLCDKARTAMIDFESQDISIDVRKKSAELR